MRILRNVLLVIIPVILMVNIYRFTAIQQVNDNGFTNITYEFHGVSYLYEKMGTFPGISTTLDTINLIQGTATSIKSVEVGGLANVIDVVKQFFKMIGLVFSIPVMLIVDVVRNLIWILGVFGIG